jgi:hypothetical protein
MQPPRLPPMRRRPYSSRDRPRPALRPAGGPRARSSCGLRYQRERGAARMAGNYARSTQAVSVTPVRHAVNSAGLPNRTSEAAGSHRNLMTGRTGLCRSPGFWLDGPGRPAGINNRSYPVGGGANPGDIMLASSPGAKGGWAGRPRRPPAGRRETSPPGAASRPGPAMMTGPGRTFRTEMGRSGPGPPIRCCLPGKREPANSRFRSHF